MAAVTNPTLATYAPPVQFQEDNSAIPAGTISKYQLGVGTVSKTYTTIKDDVDLTSDANGNQTSPVPSGLAIGNYFAAVRAVSKDGPVSAWSNEFAFSVVALTPKPPTNFSIA